MAYAYLMMSTHRRHIVSNLAHNINRKMHTRRGRSVLSYLLCCVVAFVFWLFVALDDVTERDYELKLELVNVPDSVVVLNDLPPSINVVMKGRGTQFLKYYFTKVPAMRLDFRQYVVPSTHSINISRAKIDSRIREMFGQNVNIIVVRPDSLHLSYTTGRGIKLPLRVVSNVTTTPECVLAGPAVADVDSVTVYMGNDAPRFREKFIETEQIALNDVSDTTEVEVTVKQLPNMRILPEKVRVKVPVEMLVAKTVSLPVTVTDVPQGERVLTYPASVSVQYLVPMRMSAVPFAVKATVDFKKIGPGARRVAVDLSDVPEGFKIVSLSHDSVEYVVEK